MDVGPWYLYDLPENEKSQLFLDIIKIEKTTFSSTN